MSRRIASRIGAGVLAGALAVLAAAQVPVPHVSGEWETQLEWDLQADIAVLLKTGQVLCTDRPDTGNLFDVLLFDPTDGSLDTRPILQQPLVYPEGVEDPIQSNLHCAGVASLADGRVLFCGWGDDASGTDIPLIFDPDLIDDPAGPWIQLDEYMPTPRFYPTCTSLGDGRILVSGGRDADPTCDLTVPANLPHIFDPTAPVGSQWTVMGESARRDLVWYPYMFQLSTGKVFMAGSFWYQSVSFSCTWMDRLSRLLDVQTETWTDDESSWPYKYHAGSAVMFKQDWVLKTGTGYNSLDALNAEKTYVIDTTAKEPEWTRVGDMAAGRVWVDTLALPDGTVMAVGGYLPSGGDIRYPEIYTQTSDDPPAGSWATMAATVTPDHVRDEHAVSILLPDGRVMTAGGDKNRPATSAQIFRPPYLFTDCDEYIGDPKLFVRPVIDDVPAEIFYGNTFTVTTQQADDITMVSLIRLGAVTHSYDQSQRFLNLAFSSPAETALSVVAPAHGNIGPPGYYMLFILTDEYPSVASIIKLGPIITP